MSGVEDVLQPTVYMMVEEVAHVMMPPDVNDLRWLCSQRSKPGDPQCLWTASEAFSSDDKRRESFRQHHDAVSS